jgi:CheY-like chemotaxis protein
VYIADDEEFGLEATEELVKNELHVVGKSTSLTVAIEEICFMEPEPQVAFMDINFHLPDKDGISALQDIKRDRPSVRFILFTSVSDPSSLLSPLDTAQKDFFIAGEQKSSGCYATRGTLRAAGHIGTTTRCGWLSNGLTSLAEKRDRRWCPSQKHWGAINRLAS